MARGRYCPTLMYLLWPVLVCWPMVTSALVLPVKHRLVQDLQGIRHELESSKRHGEYLPEEKNTNLQHLELDDDNQFPSPKQTSYDSAQLGKAPQKTTRQTKEVIIKGVIEYADVNDREESLHGQSIHQRKHDNTEQQEVENNGLQTTPIKHAHDNGNAHHIPEQTEEVYDILSKTDIEGNSETTNQKYADGSHLNEHESQPHGQIQSGQTKQPMPPENAEQNAPYDNTQDNLVEQGHGHQLQDTTVLQSKVKETPKQVSQKSNYAAHESKFEALRPEGKEEGERQNEHKPSEVDYGAYDEDYYSDGEGDYYYDYNYDYINITAMPEQSVQDKYTPQYMMDLYERFNRDRYSHPMANIVRSFQNINEEGDPQPTFGNVTRTHHLTFNLTSLVRGEDIYLAELRLFTLIEADRNSYLGVDRSVSLYHQDLETPQDGWELLDAKEIYGRYSGWEMFAITSALKRWVRARLTVQTIQVRIQSVFDAPQDGMMDIDTRPRNEHAPLLVVFSNDNKKRKGHDREVYELLNHETVAGVGEELEDHEDQFDTQDSYDEYLSRRKRSVTPDKDNAKETGGVYSRGPLSPEGNTMSRLENRAERLQRNQMYVGRHLPDSVMELQNPLYDPTKPRRTKRRKRRRNICRRKGLYIKFEDINWHNWIIAPKGYQAYQCTGRCYFPLSDHLTPTKHAIIQTLMHANGDVKSQRACCVPTRLDPISILYFDEQGVVTYKYRYDGMAVAQCGCR